LLLEALVPFTLRLPEGRRVLERGERIELPKLLALRLLGKVPGKVRPLKWDLSQRFQEVVLLDDTWALGVKVTGEWVCFPIGDD